MITDEQEFEVALEKVVRFLEAPHTLRSDDTDFVALLQDIERYHHTAPTPSPMPSTLQEQARSLVSQAAAFIKRRDEREQHDRWSTFPEDGDGIGPTTGV